MVDGEPPKGLDLLVAVRDAPYAETTVQMAISILEAAGGEATLVVATANSHKRPQAEAYLERLARQLAPYPVRGSVHVGEIGDEIARETVQGNYDLVIVGEQPDHMLLKRLSPHSLERMIKGLTTPVLVARHHPGPLRRFLVCEGGLSSRLLPAITGRLKPLMLTAEKITILHVMSQMSASPRLLGWELGADADQLIGKHTPEGERLEYDLSVLSPLGVNLAVKVRHGVVVEEILAEARESAADVIVLGAPHVTGFQRYLVDDPIHKVLTQGRRPVMVV